MLLGEIYSFAFYKIWLVTYKNQTLRCKTKRYKTIHKRIHKMDFTKIKTFALQITLLREWKNKHRLGENISNHISDTRLTANIYKKLSKLNNKKEQPTKIFKWAKDLNILPKKVYRWQNMKNNCSLSLVINEMLIQTTMR